MFIACLFKGSQEQSFFLQTLLFTAFLATVLKILTYAFVSTWSLVSSRWEHVKRKMHPWSRASHFTTTDQKTTNLIKGWATPSRTKTPSDPFHLSSIKTLPTFDFEFQNVKWYLSRFTNPGAKCFKNLKIESTLLRSSVPWKTTWKSWPISEAWKS